MVGSVFEPLVVRLNFTHIRDESIMYEIALRRKSSLRGNVGNGMFCPFRYSFIAFCCNYAVIQSDTVIPIAFGEGRELQDVWVFEDTAAVGASQWLESGHECAQEEGSDYEEQQVFGILDRQNDILVDQEPGLGPEV